MKMLQIYFDRKSGWGEIGSFGERQKRGIVFSVNVFLI